jgi:hypothetical protein
MCLGTSYSLYSFQKNSNVLKIYKNILLYKFLQKFKINLNHHLAQWKLNNNYVLDYLLLPYLNPNADNFTWLRGMKSLHGARITYDHVFS